MQLYSPSSRDEFSFCPRSFWLRKNGLVNRAIEYPELCAVGGNAVGYAMELWNISIMNGFDNDYGVETMVKTAKSTITMSLDEQLSHGRMIGSSKAAEFVDHLPGLVEQAIRLLYATNPLKPYAILAAEESFPHAGGSRLDVRVKQADGRGIVFDYKVKFGDMEEKWLNKEFEKHFTGEQRLTYTHLTGTDMFGIIMVLLKPMKDKKKMPPRVEVRTVAVTEDEKKVWLRDALLMTPEMDHVLTIQSPEKVRGRTYPHANQYGPCKYDDACNRYQLDPEKMSLDYITVKKEVSHVAE
jgi:hypothetical protein